MQIESTDEHRVFVSTQLASRREGRLALWAMLASSLMFVLVAPFAKIPLTHVPAFIPIYVSSLVICDLITAVLLFGQFSFLRSRALLVLAGGYLFTCSITIAYALVFPGLFSPPGLFDAGPQTTSALYMSWHGGFPLFVIAYAFSKAEGSEATEASGRPRGLARVAILSVVGSVLAGVCGLALLATAGHDHLPVFLQGDGTTDLGRAVLSSIWMLSLLALVVLSFRRPRTVLDVWLMVVMCVWLFDIALAAILNTGRYDLGWYVGRIYGLLAASFLLGVLLVENGRYYARLVQCSAKLSAANKSLEQLSLHDALTDLANRRFFDAYLADQLAVARRHQRSLALVVCDVDSFKAYNDHYGHPAGDECLRQVAAAIRSCCRRTADMAARHGGEEFAMILPDTDQAGAVRIAEAARRAVAELNIPHAHSPAAPHVSISGGVALLPRTNALSAEQLMAAADQALYQAKDAGRNRIVSAGSEPGPNGGECRGPEARRGDAAHGARAI
jgi:diguanylate cyclase (GGDEF)-like protein